MSCSTKKSLKLLLHKQSVRGEHFRTFHFSEEYPWGLISLIVVQRRKRMSLVLSVLMNFPLKSSFLINGLGFSFVGYWVTIPGPVQTNLILCKCVQLLFIRSFYNPLFLAFRQKPRILRLQGKPYPSSYYTYIEI